MAAFNKFNSFVEACAHKKHNLGSDTIKWLLSNTQPLAANAVKADITEIAPGNGYAAGGATSALTSSAQTGGTYKLVLADPPTWTATGGSIAAFQFVVGYNDTATNDELIGWYDRGSAVTLLTGDSFTLDLDATTGVLTIA